jgi:hypothetical protein
MDRGRKEGSNKKLQAAKYARDLQEMIFGWEYSFCK